MAKKQASVWTSISFWRRSAAWVTGFATILLIWLTFDTIGQIRMGTNDELVKGIKRRVPAPTVVNYKIGYKYDAKRGLEAPVIGPQKQPLFGKELSAKEASEMLHLGKLTSQAKNCMDCHTLLGNGGYYAPDLTKAWLDPMWEKTMPAITNTKTKEDAMVAFLMHPELFATHARRMPNLGITKKEAKALVVFLKHMSSIDTNGYPRGFSKTVEQYKAGGTYAK